MPVASLATVTVAPGRTAPVLSVTRPMRSAVVTCASAALAKSATAIAAILAPPNTCLIRALLHRNRQSNGLHQLCNRLHILRGRPYSTQIRWAALGESAY